MTISPPGISDEDRIRQIYVEAFPVEESESVADLASDLLKIDSDPETIHLVATVDIEIVGHIAFSPVKSQVDKKLVGYILAPLAVAPDQQNRGVGSSLVKDGLNQLRERNIDIVFVYGDPDYYSRFGFNPEPAKNYRPSFDLTYPNGWLAAHLAESPARAEPISIECVEPLNQPELW